MKSIKQLFSIHFFLPVLAGLYLVSMPAFAAEDELGFSGWYTGVLYSDSEYKARSDFGDINKNWGHIRAKGGYIFNSLLSVEGQLGMTTNSDQDKGVLSYGVYARLGKDLGQYKPYGLLGIGGFSAYQDQGNDISETGASYGAGIEIFGSKNLAVTFEYLRLIDKTIDDADVTFDTIGLGFTYYFVEDKSYFNKNRNKIRSIRY